MSRQHRHAALLAALGAATLAGCEREERRINEPPTTPPQVFVTTSALQPGPTLVADTIEGPYDDNAAGTFQGQQLFGQMNCSGCHSHGGGGMGPALMDDQWIYGSNPDQIYASIAQGRPNGMPAWKYRLTNDQIWKLVAYVRSLSALTPKGARPTRSDQMMVKLPPSQTPNAVPKNSGPPATR
jgi:cytochrome c oxidase cbb3-type subunit 3